MKSQSKKRVSLDAFKQKKSNVHSLKLADKVRGGSGHIDDSQWVVSQFVI